MTERLSPIAWTALVARWVAVAQASRSATTAEPRLRESVAPLISIEATTAALGELASVPEADRANARTLAEAAIRRAAGELDRLWRGVEWPEELHEACEKAERALRLALYTGLEELVVVGDAALEVPELALGVDGWGAEESRGTLAAMAPGTIAMPGEPIAWWCSRPGPTAPEHLSGRVERRPSALPRQIYRGLDDSGRFTDDTIASIEGDLLPGLPLLTPILVDGRRVGRFLQSAENWLAVQRRALDGRAALPVVESA